MGEVIQVSEQAMAAARIQAMLSGKDLSAYSDDVDTEDDFDIQIIDEKKTKKKRVKKDKSESNITVFKQYNVPMLDRFKKLENTQVITVTFNQHNIKYKEQDWPIPEREVNYNVELVKSTAIAKTISDKFNEKSHAKHDEAENGLTRYLVVKSYDEALVSKVRELGYVMVEYIDNKLKTKTCVNKQLCKDNNVNPDTLMNKVQSAVTEMLK